MELEFSLIVFLLFQSWGLGLLTASYGLELGSSRWLRDNRVNLNKTIQVGVIGGLVLFGIGLLSTLFHLGHPERFLNGLTNFGTSWLAREGVFGVITVVLSGFYALLWLLKAKEQKHQFRLWIGGTAIAFGLIMLFSTAMLYAAVRTIPFWNTIATILQFFASAMGLGLFSLMVILRITAAGKETELEKSLMKWGIVSLVILLIVNALLIVHLKIGLTETTVATLSFLFGANLGMVLSRMIIGVVLPMGLLIYAFAQMKREKATAGLVWVSFVCLVFGEVMARVLFFQAAFHVWGLG